MRRLRTAAVVASAATLLGAALAAQSPPAGEPPAASIAPTRPPEAAPTPGLPAAFAPPLPAEPEEDRVAFEFRVPAERGGGTITGKAGAVETSGETEVTLSGGVEIKYKDLTFRAERVIYHRDTMTVEAEGDVVFDQASRRVAATRADFDLATETGTFWKASAFAEPDQYLSGEVIVKTGDSTFEIKKGVVTSCVGDVTPDWSFRVSSADVELGGYGHLKNVRMHVKKLPVFYLPYMIWPAKTERASGFLIPNIGYTAQRGVLLGLAYYQVLGPSADLTLHLDGYEKRYAGAGAELRYAPAEGTKGNLIYQILADRDAPLDDPDAALAGGTTSREEYRVIWRHTSERLPGGFRAVVDVNHYTDYDFFREFQRGERENTRSFLYSNAFLSGNWGAQSLSMIVDQRETFRDDGETTTQNQLPEISYRLRKLKLGRMPLYLSLQSTASYFMADNPGFFEVDYGRFDLAPELTLPLKVAPWLSVAVSAAARGTWWGDSVPLTRIDPVTLTPVKVCESGEVATDQTYCGEALTRTLSGGSVEIVGPSFSRIFDSPGGRFSKLKHIIEPRIEYGYAGEYDDQLRVARFDEIDAAPVANAARAALVNRVLAKPTDPIEGGAFEIFSFELAQDYSFDDLRTLQKSKDGLISTRKGPILARIRYSPTRDFDLQAKALWSTLFNNLLSTSLSLRGKGRRAGVDLTWYTDYNPESSEAIANQVRFGGDLAIVPERLSIAGQINYDIKEAELLQHRYFINYQSQCWSVRLEYREQLTSSYESQDYRFLLTLKNVGTFLDLHGGESTDRY